MFQEFGWEVFEHPACSSDLAPTDFYLFPTLKEFLGGRRFKSDDEVEEAVKEWLNGEAEEVYEEGTQKLVTGCAECLSVDDECVEKYLGVSNSDTLNSCYFVFCSFYNQKFFTFCMSFVFMTFTVTTDLSVSYHEIRQGHPSSIQGVSKVPAYTTKIGEILFVLDTDVISNCDFDISGKTYALRSLLCVCFLSAAC